MECERFKLVLLSPPKFSDRRELARLAGLKGHVLETFSTAAVALRYWALPLVAMIIDAAGLPVWAPTLYLARSAMRGRGVTGDTARTYGESLLHWMRYVTGEKHTIATVTEELFQGYRIQLAHSPEMNVRANTANLRLTVAAEFHLWCESNGWGSPLGSYLMEREKAAWKCSLMPRKMQRHPRALFPEEIAALFQFARQPYRLAFRWGLATGLRRVEVANLRISLLPSPEQLERNEDGLSALTITRKGGSEISVYIPNSLIFETHWFVLTERNPPKPGYEDVLFVDRTGRPLSRQALSREFRRCANLIGSDATLHHLRHTYAVTVLRILDQLGSDRLEDAPNALKTLQVLLGHSQIETTEIYLRAVQMTSNDVRSALERLYGDSHETDS
ncbi:tyrosine-type recombinase/integrase [Burkholderia glumae]|uniref:tyrosine-type recombinase/integrase n=1 Tax=Burkholderia glumae TaxID=337 RepID=UPI003B9CE03D